MFYDDPITSLPRETEQRLLEEQAQRPIDTFCLRSIFCFRPLGHEGECLLRDSMGREKPKWVKRAEANALVPKELA